MAVRTGSLAPSGRSSIRFVFGAAMAGAGLLMLLYSASSAAASPSPTSQCPDGYHWDRMSGVGCVQTKLPPHGQYSYTSAAICNDGFVAVRAAGPNPYGKDPNTSYLVACLTPEQAAASAGANATATPFAGDGMGNDADDMLGTGPLDELAAGLAADGKNTTPPAQSDADLGGVAATGLLLLSAGGATILTGSAGGLAGLGGGGAAGAGGAGGAGGSGGGAGGSTGGAEHAQAAADIATAGHGAVGVGDAVGAGALPGGVAPAAPAFGGGLPLPKPELVAAGLSIFRSMKRVTSEADPSGYSAGDVAQLIGDAGAIGALASVLAPAASLVSLASAGAAAGADTADPREVLEKLRRSFGQLGYMQGVLDENGGRAEGKLAGLDGAPEGAAAEPAPAVPSDPTRLNDKQLRAARAAWAARADVAFDALLAAQAELSDLDDRRRNLGHQIDAVNDLLASLDDAGTAPVPPHLADTLRYGLGWYRVEDSDRMVAALRESQAQGRAAGRTPGSVAISTPASVFVSGAQVRASAPPRGVPFAQWAPANGFDQGKVSVLESLAGLERWCGFYDALSGTLQGQIAALRFQAHTASSTRRTLSAEIQHRTLEGGKR